MKVLRIVAIVIAVAIPGAAIANQLIPSSTDACDNCPHVNCPMPNCPFCHHAK